MSNLLNPAIASQMTNASWIRKMFEAGRELSRRVGAENVFDFSLGNPDVPPPALAANVLRGLADTVNQPMSVGYCPNQGLPSLRAALAQKLSAEQHTPVTADHLVVTCGAAGAITAFFRAVLEPADEIIVPAPYFVEYGAYAGHFGGKLLPVATTRPDFQLDIAAIEAAITAKTRVILINTPNNPTGACYTQATLNALAALLERVNANRDRPVFLLSDEPYRTLAYDGFVVPPILPLSPFAIVIGSFSKSLSLAGERIGYLLANPALDGVAQLIGAVTMTTRTLGFVNAPILGQKLVEQLLNEQVDVSIYARRRATMARVLSNAGIKFTEPRGAFYFFPEVPGGDDLAFVNALFEQNILAVPGTGFGCPGFFRLTFCVNEQTIERAADGFKRAVEKIKE